MTHNTIELMRQSKVIAQNKAPFDTGNLRYNAIRAYKTPQGFRIVMLYTAAFYGAILNEYGKGGTKGWWSTGVYTAVSTFIHSSLNNRKSAFEQASANVGKFAEGNPERQKRFYNSIVADVGHAKASAIMNQLGKSGG